MVIEDQRSLLMGERDRIIYLQRVFQEDMHEKEAQLQELIDKKQSELENYEQLLRREARDLAEREDALDRNYQKKFDDFGALITPSQLNQRVVYQPEIIKRAPVTEMNLPRQISRNQNDLSEDQAYQLDMLLSREYSHNQRPNNNTTVMGELKHENLSSILGTEHEIFSVNEDAPPTFREQNPKEWTGNFFQTEKVLEQRREDPQSLVMFEFRQDLDSSDELLY